MKKTIERFAPGFKLMSHSHFNKYFEGKFIPPINVEISPSGICNAACKFCFYRQDNFALPGWDKVYFDTDRMISLLKELVDFGVKSISWTGGGEPTMHKDFKLFSETAYKLGLEQGLFTNTLKEPKYDSSLFQWIRITYTNRPLNEKYMLMIRDCKTIGICVNFGKDDDEEHIHTALRAAEILDKAKKDDSYETYVQVRPALLIKGKSYINETPKINHPLIILTDYKFLGLISERNYTLCEAYHFSPFIWQDGDLDVCGYHRKNLNYNLGNLHDKDFKTIMENSPKNVPVIKSCQTCCKLNEMNATIETRKNIKDINFP